MISAIPRALSAAASHARLARAGTVLAVLIPLAFFAVAVMKAMPFVDDLPLPSGQGDDWVSYKIAAHNVLVGGLAMPQHGAYGALPGTVHGFIYIYFVAGIFAVFGENTAFVYAIQGLLLGTSASLIYLAWRRTLSPAAGLVLLLGAAAFIYVDVQRNIGARLLSENLFLFLLAATVFLYVEAHAHRDRGWALWSGIALGLAVLSRTSFLVAGLGLILVSAAYAGRRLVPLAIPAALILGFAIGMSPLPLREWAATGQPDLLLLSPKPSDLNRPPSEPLAFIDHYVRKAVFVLGFTTAEAPEYRWRPHWMLLWIGFAAYAVWRLRRPRLERRELVVLVVVVLYLGPVVALSWPSNYGGRMVTVILPLVLAVVVQFLDETIGRRWSNEARGQDARGGLVTTSTT